MGLVVRRAGPEQRKVRSCVSVLGIRLAKPPVEASDSPASRGVSSKSIKEPDEGARGADPPFQVLYLLFDPPPWTYTGAEIRKAHVQVRTSHLLIRKCISISLTNSFM